jgi:ketosteroid isomerase-like protein
MGNTNVDTAREVIEAYNRRDFDAALLPLTDDVTWEAFLLRTDMGVIRGKEKLRAAWESQTEAVLFRVEPEEVVAIGDNKVVAPSRLILEGRSSQLKVDAQATWLATFSRGLVQSVQVFETTDEALAAARANVALVLSLYDAVERADYDAPFRILDEDIVWDMSGFGLPDMAKVYRGHEGVRDFWTAWIAVWETIEFRTLTPEDFGEHVIVEVEQRNSGRASGAAVDFHYFQSFTLRDGKLAASHMAPTRAEALRTVGLD